MRAAEYGDDWPLYYYSESTRLNANRSRITKLIDTRNGLLDEMFSAVCINDRQRHFIEADATDEVQSERLFSIVLWGSLATYNVFINCLKQTKQHHVVYVLEPSLAGDIRPLSDEQRSQLQKNYATLVYMITLDGGLAVALYSADCITWRQKRSTLNMQRSCHRNARNGLSTS